MREKKVLFMVANIRVSNGVTSVVMNNYDKLIKDGYQVDFCAMYDRPSPYFDKLKEYGSNYYLLPQKDDKPNEEKAYSCIEDIISKNNYTIVHNHILGRYGLMVCDIAKKYKVPFRIFHSHNPNHFANYKQLIAHYVFEKRSLRRCNNFLACSSFAGKSLFGKRDFTVIKNTIDVNKFVFDIEKRRTFREENGIDEDDFVVGTVCRYTFQKNPMFMVDIFEKILQKEPNAKFVWAGTGELENQLKEYIASKNLQDKIILLGNCSDTVSVYCGMDAFLLPSRFEGLGFVFIEAQACGVKCYASDVVPKDTEITDLISYYPLNLSSEKWADEILKGKNSFDENVRKSYNEEVIKSGYDTDTNTDLIDFYNKLLKD